METSIAVFRGKEIRKTIHNNEWWFSVADVVELLTDSTDPRQYIKKMRQRDSELNSCWGTICTPLRLKALDGKMRKTNCANTEGMRAAHKGGEVAGKARKNLERKTRKKVVSPENYLDIPQKRRKQLNEKE